jgi:ribulose 1,5-bisphosphate carboxylase large subunit-like protein
LKPAANKKVVVMMHQQGKKKTTRHAAMSVDALLLAQPLQLSGSRPWMLSALMLQSHSLLLTFPSL